MTKSCPKGQYYCYTDKKCKKIPKGYMIGARGYLRQEPQEDDSKKNGNGNGNGHSNSNGSGRNGSGNGNGNSSGNGSSGGVSEATMTSSQKRKDTMLKKKYDDSDMKKNMKKQYGKEKGEKVYYATIRKQAMESTLGKLDEVDYYSGQDRNPNTGLPKNVRSVGSTKKDKPLNRVPHEILRAHREIPVTDIEVTSMDELTSYKSFIQQSIDAKKREADRQKAKQQSDKEYSAKKKERVQKGIKFYDKKGKGYIKGGVKTYEENKIQESEFTDFAKKYGLDPLNDFTKIKRMMRSNRLRGINNNPTGIKNIDQVENESVQTEGSLHKWFKGSKSKDGKPGWVNVKTGGTCASDEPGEGTPKCVSSSKRASMSKAERESASRRKKAADPNQQQKSGAAKPTYVKTDIKEEDKKGKGSGKKDACYHKVKASAKVWPSAYASGRLVQCRKKGAANYGNSKKESMTYSDFMDECWKTHKQQGLKKKGNRMVPNCVPKNEEVQKEGTSYGLYKGDGKPKGPMAKFGEKKKKEKKIEEKVNLKDKSSQYARSTKEVDTAMTDHVNRKRGTHYGKDGKVTEVGRYRRPSKREARKELEDLYKKESKSYSKFVEGAAWTKKSGKNKEGGLNEKGRKSYERENPGSDLKAPSKKVGNPRRASFCARMKGMKKKLTSSKTANDPDSRINKSLRKWNC